MSYYENVRPLLNQIANWAPSKIDVRTPGARVEVMDVMWWPSNNADFAGDMLVWRGFNSVSPTTPVTLRYKRACPLYRAKPDDTYEPSGELIYQDGVILVSNSSVAAIRNTMRFYNETIEIVGQEPPPSTDPDATPVYGKAPTVRATAIFPFGLSRPFFAFGANIFREPFNVFPDRNNIQQGIFEAVQPVVYTVTHATGSWLGATNIIVGYVGDSNNPLEWMREVAVVRGDRD